MYKPDKNAPKNIEPATEQHSAQKERSQLMFTLAIVLIICGGNGIGLVAGGLLWKFTGQALSAIVLMIAITILAFSAAMLLLVRRNKRTASKK